MGTSEVIVCPLSLVPLLGLAAPFLLQGIVPGLREAAMQEMAAGMTRTRRGQIGAENAQKHRRTRHETLYRS